MTAARPKVLSLVALADSAVGRLEAHADLTMRPWTVTRELADPSELAGELVTVGHTALFVEADFVLRETFEAAPDLRFVGVCRGDFGHVEVEAATESGVPVIHTPGRNAPAVAEITIGLMLALLRRIPAAAAYVAEGRWDDPVDAYTTFRGGELGDQVVGVIGLGSIGRETVARLRGFGCPILGTDPALGDAHIRDLGCEPVELDDLIARASVVAVHCPSLETTRGLIDAAEIARMPTGAYLIVTTGEGVVNEAAVARALTDGRLAGAAFDVFDTHPIRPDHPLLSAPNALLLPHIGGATDRTVERHSHMIVDDYLRFLAGERPHRLANPEVWNHRG